MVGHLILPHSVVSYTQGFHHSIQPDLADSILTIYCRETRSLLPQVPTALTIVGGTTLVTVVHVTRLSTTGKRQVNVEQPTTLDIPEGREGYRDSLDSVEQLPCVHVGALFQEVTEVLELLKEEFLCSLLDIL
jgi:hypothetical protein